MARKKVTRLQWQKEAAQLFEIGFGTVEELVRGKTALEKPGTQTVLLMELTSERPEVWTDRTADVTISNIGIVDDLEDDGTLILADGAVQFTIESDPQGEAPVAGNIWSFLVVANRADDPTLQVSERVWVNILP